MKRSAPDVVYLHGKIVTVDSRGSIAEALAIKGDRIVAVGSDDEIRDLADASTQVVDLRGNTVLPGINDCHVHAALAGGTRPPLTLDVGYPAVKSIADIKEAVRAKAGESEAGEWIRGFGWDEGYLAECLADRARHLTRWDLDEVAPNNPVYLAAANAHELVANSWALQVAGITRDTRANPGSEIVKAPDTGEPTGMLQELSAVGLIMAVVPPWTRREKRDGILRLMRDLNSRGITSITEPGLGPGGLGMMDSECISIYNDLYNEGALTVRVNILYLFGDYGVVSLDDFKNTIPLIGIHSGFGNEWLKIGGVKLFADGQPFSKTAWMHDEYPDGGNGGLVIPRKTDKERYHELVEMIVYAHKHGFQCGIHSIGDRAIEACIDGFIKAQNEEPRELRHYLIHCDFVSPADIERMAKSMIGMCAQPILKWTFSDAMDTLVGLERSEWQWPLRSLLDAGINVSGSSDAPVSEPDWLQGIEAAVLRKSRASGTLRGPQQRISVTEAIRIYTMGSAWQDHMEHLKGSLEPSKLADFCVLDRDILSIEPDVIHSITNLATVVGGRLVYDQGLEL